MKNSSNPRPDFTLREIEIILCSKQNLSCQEIADKLFISISTVKKHRQNILGKIAGAGKSDFRSLAWLKDSLPLTLIGSIL